jgi:DNA-binding transcriptional MerR regulator
LAPPGERSYLAIGDVLALLREEFPDVTISKIRFLESRGLVVPERTPTGYRKFYERDVERLRWILRQQREHFLPLKVLRERLENCMTDPAADEPVTVTPVGKEWTVRVVRAGRRPDDYAIAYRELAGLIEVFELNLEDLAASEITVASVDTSEGPGIILVVKHEIRDD